MKRLLTILLCLVCFVQASAVLKEKDLTHTLGVLKAELKRDYEKQKQMKQRYEYMSAEQHGKLISYMKRSEQIGLILFSQKADFTFDMAYACQEATQLYKELRVNTVPYDQIRNRVTNEIERYNELIALLKQMPPAIREAKDSITSVDSMAIDMAEAKVMTTAEEKDEHPYFLEGVELQDRMECLEYAEQLLEYLQFFLNKTTQEQKYYDEVSERVQKMNDFAQKRYQMLQQSIFKDGGKNYISILLSLPQQIQNVKNDIINKYMPLEDNGTGVSEWRGMYVLFISIFMLIYIALAIIVSYVIMRWLLPKRLRNSKLVTEKRTMLTYVLGAALFAIFATIARAFTDRNIVLMGTSLMITFAWLMEAIFLSLLIRMDSKQLKHGAKVYIPFMWMAFVVIVFRIILIPNTVVNLIYPPILLVFTIWQMRTLKKHKMGVPTSDMFYSSISLLTMIFATIAAWVGYTLLAVEIMMWWMFQLTFIQSITCIYDLVKVYETSRLIYKICPELRERERQGEDVSEERAKLLRKIKKGEYISKTWMYDFVLKALIPVLAVLSVLFSIYWAADIFEMTSICITIFMSNFIEQEGIVSLSLFKICMVTGFWFIFKYFNYVLRSLYHHIRRRTLGDSVEDYNGTLANNVISITVWGGYFIFALMLLKVPSSGISIVTAGLATGMGFAMKDLLENFFYGISLMSGRVRVGDYIECDGIRGKVEKITYQSTSIVTTDGCIMAFLNATLFSKNFKNLTRNHQYELVKIPIGVAYGSHVQQVREILQEALAPLKELKTKAGKPIIDENTTINVAFSNFGDNSIDLLVCIWVLVEENIPLTGKAKEIIYNTLSENKINIPFPQREVYVHQVQ